MLHAYEVKCSRSDWLRELKEPEKAEAAALLCDKFSVVAADNKIVAEGELPHTWGLLVVRSGKLVCVKDAPLLPDAKPKAPVARSFVVALLRAGGAVPQAESSEVLEARREGERAGRASMHDAVDDARSEIQSFRQMVARFEKESGVALTGWNASDAVDVGRAVRAVLDGERAAKQAADRLRRVQQTLRHAADALDPYLQAEA